MITFVLWKWTQQNYKTKFTADHVNGLARMIHRHYEAPHRIVCVTNWSEGIDKSVEIVKDRGDFAKVASPHGGQWPSCYRRLRMFGPDALEVFGERFASIDLDCVILRDIRPLFDRDEDFVGWQDPLRPTQHCGSLTLLRAGSRSQVWDGFNPHTSPQEAMEAGFLGSDQGWVSYCLPGEAQWTRADGVYSYRFDLDAGKKLPPENARIVVFHGRFKPWDAPAVSLQWVKEASN